MSLWDSISAPGYWSPQYPEPAIRAPRHANGPRGVRPAKTPVVRPRLTDAPVRPRLTDAVLPGRGGGGSPTPVPSTPGLWDTIRDYGTAIGQELSNANTSGQISSFPADASDLIRPSGSAVKVSKRHKKKKSTPRPSSAAAATAATIANTIREYGAAIGQELSNAGTSGQITSLPPDASDRIRPLPGQSPYIFPHSPQPGPPSAPVEDADAPSSGEREPDVPPAGLANANIPYVAPTGDGRYEITGPPLPASDNSKALVPWVPPVPVEPVIPASLVPHVADNVDRATLLAYIKRPAKAPSATRGGSFRAITNSAYVAAATLAGPPR